MAAAIVPTLTYNIEPSLGYMVYQITYTKANQNDYINVSSYTAIKTILFCVAYDDTAGAIDETTFSGTTITFTDSTTGAGSLLVVGKGV